MKSKLQPLIQVMLLLAIAGAASAWFVIEPEVPDVSKIGDIGTDFDPETDWATTEPLVAESRWDNLGQKEIFRPLIPPPTPKPKTPRPPKNLPDIGVMLRNWQLSYIARGQAVIEDRRTKKEIKLKVGQTETVNRGRNQILTVTLTKLDQRNFIATFGAPAKENATELTQVFELKLF